MTINDGTYGGSLLAACGAVNVFGEEDQPYPVVDLGAVAARSPDLTVAPTEPYAWAERHAPLFAGVAPMVLVDGRDLFWWGVRTAGARDRLADRIAAARP